MVRTKVPIKVWEISLWRILWCDWDWYIFFSMMNNRCYLRVLPPGVQWVLLASCEGFYCSLRICLRFVLKLHTFFKRHSDSMIFCLLSLFHVSWNNSFCLTCYLNLCYHCFLLSSWCLSCGFVSVQQIQSLALLFPRTYCCDISYV